MAMELGQVAADVLIAQHINKLLENKYIHGFLAVALGILAGNTVNPDNNTKVLLSHTLVRAVIYYLIVYMASKDTIVSIVVATALVLYTDKNKKLLEGFSPFMSVTCLNKNEGACGVAPEPQFIPQGFGIPTGDNAVCPMYRQRPANLTDSGFVFATSQVSPQCCSFEKDIGYSNSMGCVCKDEKLSDLLEYGY